MSAPTTPDTPPTIPELDGSEYTIGRLMCALMAGDTIPVPCWVRFGRTRHKITAENKRGIEIGLLLALEIRTQE